MASSGRGADISKFVTIWTSGNPPYAILKWTIENLCCAETCLRSPCFEINQASKWNLLLDPKVFIGGEAFIGIYLKRDDSSGPEKVMLNGELSVHGPSNELIFDKIFDETCDKNKIIEFRVAKVVFPVHPSPDDSYLVRCEMAIASEINSVDASRSHFQKLSTDYKQLYSDKKFTDIYISASDDIISLHKAVLHARSPLLAEKLNNHITYLTEKTEESVFLSVVLLFLYTGDPDLLMSSVPLEMVGKIHKIAKKWQLNELTNFLTPFKMHCKTCLRNESFQYTWEIKNFSKLNAESSGVLHSSEFCTNNEIGARWRLTLEKRLHDSVTFYGLYLEKISSNNSSNKANTEFRIYNSKGNSVLKRREFVFGPRANQKCGFSSIFDESFVQTDMSHDDTLKVICNLKIRLNSESWIDFKSTSIDVSDNDNCCLKYLKIMSSNFKDLYESEAYSDLKVYAGEKMFKVHKAVLWARSPYFSNILNEYSAEYCAVPIQEDIFKEILLYMYSAELPDITNSNMQKMYEAATLLRLTELFLVCKSYIILHITVDNVLESLILAKKYEDKQLEEAAEKFASFPTNAKLFLNTHRWRIFRDRHINLAFRIYHNLACQTF